MSSRIKYIWEWNCVFTIWWHWYGLQGLYCGFAVCCANIERLFNILVVCPPMENGAAVKAAYRIAGDKMPYIVQTPVVRIPCCMGVFKKRILIPEKSFSDTELYYIIFHEYIHLQNNDFLVKMLINMLCAFYWWNPFVCLLKKDLNQSMEIRCDSLVVQRLEIGRASCRERV